MADPVAHHIATRWLSERERIRRHADALATSVAAFIAERDIAALGVALDRYRDDEGVVLVDRQRGGEKRRRYG